jgi:prophage regulatory protein
MSNEDLVELSNIKPSTAKERLLRWPEVEERVGLRRARVHQLIALGKFPKQIRLSLRASAWVESEIDDWIAQRIAESRSSDDAA